MTKDIQHPQVNLNGTSGDALLEAHRAALDALRNGLHFLRENAPHGRDYQTLPAGALARAQREHAARVRLVQSVFEEVEALTIGVSDQVSQREQRRAL